MPNMKNFLKQIEKNKGKIMKFLISCAAIEFIISTLYRIVNVKDSRTQVETIINIYSVFFVFIIFLHEICSCLILKSITENLKIITHYRGKGIVFILLSMIYFSPSLGNQQNYSASLLFSVGIVSFFAEIQFNKDSMNLDENVEIKATEECINNTTVLNVEKKSNPYDIPDDF